jgi:hypothetical protein
MGAVPADAATKPKNVTLVEAAAALPAAKLMPGSLSQAVQVQTPGHAVELPCLETEDFSGVVLAGSQVTALYTSKKAPTDGHPIVWSISATVFHDAIKAKAAMAKVIDAEHACQPQLTMDDGQGDVAVATRTHHQRYSVGGWHGYRTVDHFSTTAQGQTSPIGRLMDVFLQRGNVLLHLQEGGLAVAGSGALQDQQRRTVTQLLIDRFDAKR